MVSIRRLVKGNKLFFTSEAIILILVLGLSLACDRFNSTNFWLVFGITYAILTLIAWAWTWNRKWSQFYF